MESVRLRKKRRGCITLNISLYGLETSSDSVMEGVQFERVFDFFRHENISILNTVTFGFLDLSIEATDVYSSMEISRLKRGRFPLILSVLVFADPRIVEKFCSSIGTNTIEI